MALFTKFDPKTKMPGEPVNVVRADVKSFTNRRLKYGDDTNPSCTEVVLNDGTEFLVTVPTGEFHDRLNDDTAKAPDPSMFENMAQAPSTPADPDEDFVQDDEEPEAVAD